MAESDRLDDETPRPPPKPKRRRRPPTLELSAKEIEAEDRPKSETREQVRDEPKAGTARSRWAEWREHTSAFNAGSIFSAPLVAGLAGIAAGALIVYLFAGSSRPVADPRAAELTSEIAKLSARVESLAARPTPPAGDSPLLGQRIDRLTAAIGESEQRLAAIEKRPPPEPADLSGVNQRTAAIEDTLRDLRTALGELRRATEKAPPAATPADLNQLSTRIGGLEQRIASLAAPRVAAAASSIADDLIVLNALSLAVQSGRPFAKELEAARSRLGERAAPLVKIEPFATDGLPTVAALAERFSALAPELLRRRDPDGGFFSKLFSNAVRLVEVRQVGEPQGSSAGAIVARTETKLSRGDLAGAIVEVEALPEPARSRAADWIAAAKQRRDVDTLLKSFVDATLAANAERAKP